MYKIRFEALARGTSYGGPRIEGSALLRVLSPSAERGRQIGTCLNYAYVVRWNDFVAVQLHARLIPGTRALLAFPILKLLRVL